MENLEKYKKHFTDKAKRLYSVEIAQDAYVSGANDMLIEWQNQLKNLGDIGDVSECSHVLISNDYHSTGSIIKRCDIKEWLSDGSIVDSDRLFEVSKEILPSDR